MDISHTQPKLLDAEHAWGRKFQKEKNTFEVRDHLSTWSCTLSVLLLLLYLMLSK